MRSGFCRVKEWKYQGNERIKHVCIRCGELLKNEDEVALFLNNWKLFPNAMVHKHCVDEFGGYESCIRTLQERYKKHQELLKEAEALWHEIKEEEYEK